MSSETYFLQPVSSGSNPISAEAVSSAQFFDYSQAASDSLNSVDLQALVQGGVAFAISNADSLFINDPGFTNLFTEALVEGIDGSFEVESSAETEVVATFEIEANQTFSFDFIADMSLESTEIENPNTAYSEAQSRMGFLILDTSDVDRPEIVDFAGVSGTLISSEKKGRVFPVKGSRKTKIASYDTDKDIDGDNGEDYVNFFASGSYERSFNQDTQLTVVEINRSSAKLRGDNSIENFGDDVRYGTVGVDRLNGTNSADKIYGSLEDDYINGKKGDDILEGGGDDDYIKGGQGNDKIHGGSGEDTLIGGKGSDSLVGGEDADWFVFKPNHLQNNQVDVIVDFEVGIDKIKAEGWGSIDPNSWFSDAIASGDFTNSSNGALYSLNNGGQILFEGVNLDSLNSSDFVFS
ncbi:MAG: calcium-binding protein [Microcoleaceae cyanobacterium]